MKTYAEAKDARDHLDARLAEATAALKSIPGVGSGQTGLTPDHVKTSPAYRAAKAEVDRVFAALRKANAFIAKHYRQDAAAERKARRRPQPEERKAP